MATMVINGEFKALIRGGKISSISSDIITFLTRKILFRRKLKRRIRIVEGL